MVMGHGFRCSFIDIQQHIKIIDPHGFGLMVAQIIKHFVIESNKIFNMFSREQFP